jgi:hypothetical protein
MASSTTKKCVICELIYEDDILVRVTTKGLENLRKSAIKRQQPLILKNIVKNCFLHEKCRKNYVSKINVNLAVKKASELNKNICVFFKNRTLRDKENIRVITSEQVEITIRNVCSNRKDEWSIDVLGFLGVVGNLFENKIWYHSECYARFTTGKTKPKDMIINHKESNKRKLEEISIGKPVDIQREECFLLSLKFLKK